MAIRQVRERGDEILNKVSKKVVKFDKKLEILLDDMYETMQKNDGVGIAGPQVGILKRVAVVDVGEGRIDLVNPVITEQSGTQNGAEGCLSVPGLYGEVERPNEVTVVAQDKDGNEFTVKAEGFLARAFCHEIDHLDGHLFTEKVTKYIDKE